MLPVKGKLPLSSLGNQQTDPVDSILEYLSREDAERAVKELDGRDLRGQPVRVAMDREVCLFIIFLNPY